MNVLSALVLLALGGCVMSHAPKGDLGFQESSALRDFAGCYRNIADGGNGTVGPFLSFLIWPKPPLHPAKVEAVKVSVEEGRTLVVEAYAKQGVAWRSAYRLGQDFDLTGGVITRRETMGSAPTAAGNVFLGVGHEAVRFGVDPQGSARVESATTMVGTAFLVIPIAGHSNDVYRFSRAPELCGGS
jgi:hypothetical protein